MKFIFFTDMHGRANNPVSRLDNYPETVLKKLEWVVKTANEKDAVLLFGGDWLNRPDTSPSFIGNMAAILSKLKNGPCYTVLGNHDIYGYNVETFPRTPLYILAQIGIIKILDETTPTLFDNVGETGDITVVGVTGASASYDIDKADKKHYMAEITEPCDTHIHIVHGFLTNKEWPYVEHTLIDDIAGRTHANIILSGHEHSGFGVIKKKGDSFRNHTLFCNPGALLRVSAGIGDMNMAVRVAEITVNGFQSEIEFIYCPEDIALPAAQVIDRERLLKEKEHEQKINSFFRSIAETDIEMFDTTDIMAVFKQFAEQEDINADIQKEIVKRLSIASEKVDRENDDEEDM